MKFLVLTLVVATVHARPGVSDIYGSYLPGVWGGCSILSSGIDEFGNSNVGIEGTFGVIIPFSLGFRQSKPEIHFVKYKNQAKHAFASGLYGQAVSAGHLDLDNGGSFMGTLGQGGFGGGSVGTFGTSAFLGNVGIISPNIQGQQILFGYYPDAFGGPGGGIPGGGIPGGGIPGGGIPGGGIPGGGIPGGGIPGGGIPGGNFGIINPNILGQQILFGYYPDAFGGPGGGIPGGGIPGGVFGTSGYPSIRYGTPGFKKPYKRW